MPRRHKIKQGLFKVFHVSRNSTRWSGTLGLRPLPCWRCSRWMVRATWCWGLPWGRPWGTGAEGWRGRGTAAQVGRPWIPECVQISCHSLINIDLWIMNLLFMNKKAKISERLDQKPNAFRLFFTPWCQHSTLSHYSVKWQGYFFSLLMAPEVAPRGKEVPAFQLTVP